MSEIKVEWYPYPEKKPEIDDEYLVTIHIGDFTCVCIGKWNSCDKRFYDPNTELALRDLMGDDMWNRWYSSGRETFSDYVIAWTHVIRPYRRARTDEKCE